MLGAFVAITSALAFSLNGILVRRGVAHATSSQGAFVTVLMGVPMFVVASVLAGQIMRIGELSASAFGYLTAAGAVHFVFGRYFNYRAIGLIGAARTAPVQALQIPYSIGVAIIALGEGVTFWMLVGVALIMLAPVVMVERRARTAVPAGPLTESPQRVDLEQPQLLQVEGYVSAFISAIAYGTSPILIRAALEGESGLSILGGLLSYSAAAILLLGSAVLPSQRAFIRTINLTIFRVFFMAAIAIFLAQMLRFIALSLASVAVVSTLQRSSAVFTLLLTWALNRHLEVITWRLVASVVISVAGAVLLIAAS